jgi:hypothetical protein
VALTTLHGKEEAMPRGKTAKSLALIDACYEILDAIQPATVRAVCYQLFIRGLIPSMAKTCTNGVSSQLVYARKAGLIPWEWIVDETREAEYPGTWANPEQFARAAMHQYRRDRWQGQNWRVEVWSEKGTVRGTLAPLLADLGVTFRVMHGHTSWTTAHEIADAWRADPRPFVAFYGGDFDPSGLHMSVVDLPQRFAQEEVDILVERLALHGNDAARQQLPSFSVYTKKHDTRYPWFLAHYGEQCWELDALSPAVLRDRVHLAIEGLIDLESWQRYATVDAAEQRSLAYVLGQWQAVIAGQAQE